MACSNFAAMNQKALSIGMFTTALVASGIIALASTESASAATSIGRGPKGQTISISRSPVFNDGEKVVVTGKNFNTKLGIYVTYCVIPPKGQRPDLCGPFDITGQNNASTWVSSNPPVFAKLLVKPFGKGGTFKISVTITRMIGDQDCSLVRCAITTRADHINGSDRSADVFIPVTVKQGAVTPGGSPTATPAP